jgi:hypothetical protein
MKIARAAASSNSAPPANHPGCGPRIAAGGPTDDGGRASLTGTVGAVVSSLLTLVLIAAVVESLTHHSATRRPALARAGAPVAARALAPGHPPVRQSTVLAAVSNRPAGGRPPRPMGNPFRSSDMLAPHRAITGRGAHVRWWERLLSLVGLGAMVVMIGALVAALAGGLFFGARIALELVVG